MANISKAAGLAKGVLSRFVNGGKTLSLDTVDKICRVLKLELRRIE
jgi:hypothetical protein